ncbi:MAG TPA: DUF393 domain-containing protein [Caldithrix sp.]|nr:DUF393 domain-containing protein [Caldithrix sp.]
MFVMQAPPFPRNHPVIFFDRYCVLCNRSVDFILKHDRDAIFRFITLQSAAASQFLQTVPAPAPIPMRFCC